MLKRKPHHALVALIVVLGIGGIGYAGVSGASADTTIPKIKINTVKVTTPTTSHSGQTAAAPAPASTPAVTEQAAKKKAASPAAAVPATPAPKVVSSVAKGSTLYASSSQSAAITQAASSASNASDAAVLSRLAGKSTAQWFGDWNGDIQAAVNSYVSAAQGSLPVLVAYNIPGRDCGGQSAGGASSATSYADWIQKFGRGINGRQAIVILEPDAVAADCFSAARAALLSDAIKSLQAAGASVYLDDGNPTWRTVSDTVSRLNQAGVAYASGFSLNVSNFQTTSANISYGSAISAQIGDKHFVIDTSRNGNGPSGNEWCNPAGRALGNEPTTQTGYRLVDAYLWIKVPGESDGACGPAINGSQPPAAGTFWPAYALMLARNAGW